MANPLHGSGVVAGTAGGTLVSIVSHIGSSGEYVHTSLLAALGAVVSFLVSILLKWLIRALGKWYRRRF